MTIKQMNKLGFYCKSRSHPNLWKKDGYEYTFNIPYLKGASVESLLSMMYEAGYDIGILEGKEQKAEEIKKILNIKN